MKNVALVAASNINSQCKHIMLHRAERVVSFVQCFSMNSLCSVGELAGVELAGQTEENVDGISVSLCLMFFTSYNGDSPWGFTVAARIFLSLWELPKRVSVASWRFGKWSVAFEFCNVVKEVVFSVAAVFLWWPPRENICVWSVSHFPMIMLPLFHAVRHLWHESVGHFTPLSSWLLKLQVRYWDTMNWIYHSTELMLRLGFVSVTKFVIRMVCCLSLQRNARSIAAVYSISLFWSYVNATEPSLLMLCKVWGLHSGVYEEWRLLEYKNPVRTSGDTLRLRYSTQPVNVK
jgi:hypothetical protein